MDAAAVVREVQERRVPLVRLWFTDVLGFLKSFAVPAEELERALSDGIGFDGSAIEGFARVEEEDVIARPDPVTFRLLPARGGDVAARMLCDITYPDGAPFEGDPRFVLRRNLERARALGYRFVAAPEIEFFLSRSAEQFDPADRGGYFDLTASDVAEAFRRRTLDALGALGIAVESVHHEDAPGQQEIDLASADALDVADAIVTLRLTVKEVAQELGLHASFMPKPEAGVQGSGMHTHFRLYDGDRNAFFDPTSETRLSKVGRSFVAGLLEHARAITAVTNQWVNSYKRLVPGYEAPVHVTWGRRNRSALVRVPADRPDDESACRIEYRAPDPACNPYLMFSVVLAAGLEGIESDAEPPPEATETTLDEEEARAAGIASLPDNLHDAIALMERSDLVAQALGEHVFEWLGRNKREEWDEYRSYVTPWELDRSFPVL